MSEHIGTAARAEDTALGRVTQSEYDDANRPIRVKSHENGVHLYTGELSYDVYGNAARYGERIGPGYAAYETTYGYDEGDRLTALGYGDASNKLAYTYDGIGRVSQRTVTAGNHACPASYTYEAGGYGTGSTTALVKRIVQNGKTMKYTYDDTGNIVSLETRHAGGVKEKRCRGECFSLTGVTPVD